MRIHPRGDVSAISDPRYPEGFEPDSDGSFNLPEEVAVTLLGTRDALGAPAWETTSQRDDRLVSEELERRRDPSSLYDELRAIRQGNGIPEPAVTATDLRAQAQALHAQADALDAATGHDAAGAARAEQERVDAEKAVSDETARKERVANAGQLGAGDVPPEVNGDDHEGEDKHSDGLAALDVVALRAAAKDRGLAQTGRKGELITRIREHDQEHAENVSAEPPLGTAGASNVNSLDPREDPAEPQQITDADRAAQDGIGSPEHTPGDPEQEADQQAPEDTPSAQAE